MRTEFLTLIIMYLLSNYTELCPLELLLCRSSDKFPAMRFSAAGWTSVILRVHAFCIECLDDLGESLQEFQTLRRLYIEAMLSMSC